MLDLRVSGGERRSASRRSGLGQSAQMVDFHEGTAAHRNGANLGEFLDLQVLRSGFQVYRV